jgi:hypothetical protein
MSKDSTFRGLDEILAIYNILRITTNSTYFEKWLKKYHKIENITNEISEGYKFFLETIIRILIATIESDTALEIEEDYTFFRAVFKGIALEDIPNTCEKTIFIKNIWNLIKPLRKSTNWEEIKKSIKNLKTLLKVLRRLFEESTSTIDIEKNSALSVTSIFHTYIFLNDTHRGLPHGYYLPSNLKISSTPKYLKKVFRGYALTLQYLWFKLLGEKEFNKFCVKDLHRAAEIYSKKAEEYINIELESLPKKQRKEKESELLQLKEWYALDNFFGRIRDDIIDSLEKQFKLSLGIESLFSCKKIDKGIFSNFLSKEDLKEPEYFKKEKYDEIRKWLDYKLLWYNTEVLSSTGIIFSGVPAFISILNGLVNFSKDKVLVKIFKHPEKGINGYKYSYGILIPVFGTSGLTDYSGWLIFFCCATDFSGFGISLYAQAKAFINLFKEDGKIEVEEIEVDEKIFKEFLKEKSVSSVFDSIIAITPFGPTPLIDISKIEEDKRHFINDVRGVLFEFIVYKWLNLTQKFEEIHHYCIIDKLQIDICCLDKSKIHLFECTITIHKDKIEEKLKAIKKQIAVLKNKYPQYDIVPSLVVYSQLPSNVKKFFEDNKIRVIENFKKEIETSRVFSKEEKRKILQILEHKE